MSNCKLFRVAIFLGLLSLLFLYGCPFYNLLHIPCPCCGVTRAWVAFFHGDISGAFAYHALFPLIPLLIPLYCLHDLCQGFLKKVCNGFSLLLAAALFLYNILRWCGIVVMP